jgi:hypothetical protein
MSVDPGYPSNNANLRPVAGEGPAPDVPGVFPGANPGSWIYDFDPKQMKARATYYGVVVGGGGGGGSIFTPTEPGLVPPPLTAPDNSYLQADGTWHQDVVRQPVESGLVFGNVSGINATMYPFTIMGLTPFLSEFTATAKGIVAASGGGTVNFLRADNTWQGVMPSAGVTNGSDAAAGNVGQFIEQTFTAASPVPVNVSNTLGTFTLTAGDWDISGFATLGNGGFTGISVSDSVGGIFPPLINVLLGSGNWTGSNSVFPLTSYRRSSNNTTNGTISVSVYGGAGLTFPVSVTLRARRMR